MIDFEVIGKRIKDRRIEIGLTQEKMAEQLDISVSLISRIERAVVKLSLETLGKIATLLKVTPSFLIDGTTTNSNQYLRGEFSEMISGFNANKMKFTLAMTELIKDFDCENM